MKSLNRVAYSLVDSLTNPVNVVLSGALVLMVVVTPLVS